MIRWVNEQINKGTNERLYPTESELFSCSFVSFQILLSTSRLHVYRREFRRPHSQQIEQIKARSRRLESIYNFISRNIMTSWLNSQNRVQKICRLQLL